MKTILALLAAAALLAIGANATEQAVDWDAQATADCQKHCIPPTVKESKSQFCRKYLKVGRLACCRNSCSCRNVLKRTSSH